MRVFPWHCHLTIKIGEQELHVCGRGETADLAERDAERGLEIAIADIEEANAKRRARG